MFLSLTRIPLFHQSKQYIYFKQIYRWAEKHTEWAKRLNLPRTDLLVKNMRKSYFVDTLQCVYAFMMLLLYLGFWACLIVAVLARGYLNIFCIAILGCIIILETCALIVRLRLEQFNRVYFSISGITVFRLGKKICDLPWDQVKEVGIKYWSGKDEHDRLRTGGQYIYFADHLLTETERISVGSYHQRNVAQNGIAFFVVLTICLMKIVMTVPI